MQIDFMNAMNWFPNFSGCTVVSGGGMPRGVFLDRDPA
jgi:hypothetical protein